MKFDSQICTTTEQSKRLLTLGLKRETADMAYEYKPKHPADTDTDKDWVIVAHSPCGTDIPAWSLHRLIEIWRESINASDYLLEGDAFEKVINNIEWLIKKSYINKEYLK